jgi:hypothetical protein
VPGSMCAWGLFKFESDIDEVGKVFSFEEFGKADADLQHQLVRFLSFTLMSAKHRRGAIDSRPAYHEDSGVPPITRSLII